MKIVNVYKTHFDIGFTELSRDVVARYSTNMLEDVLKTCEETQALGKGMQFVWTMASWPLLESLKHCSSENLVRAEALIKRGQLVCHALPFTFHLEFLSAKQIEYSFKYTREFCDRYSLPYPVSAKMTDVPGHTRGLIRPLVKNGVKFLHLGCNPASSYPLVPTLFFWENEFGERVLVFYNKTYGSSLIPPTNWEYPVWLSMQQSNDNIGPQDSTVINGLYQKAKESIKDLEFTVGTMDDFYNEIIKCDLSNLPVIKTDLGDTWIHGVASYPKEVGALRRAREVEKLDSFEGDAEYYENALLFGEHTWGLDVKTHLTWQRSYEKEAFKKERELPRYKLMEESWFEQRSRAAKCCEIASKHIKKEPTVCGVVENEFYSLRVENNRLVIFDKLAKAKVTMHYEYEIIGTDKVTEFLRSYLTRFYEWALSDFGRQSYGEVEDMLFESELKHYKACDEKITLTYVPVNADSFIKYGNAKEINMTAFITGKEVRVIVELKGKQASPFIEGGNLFFDTDIKKGEYLVGKVNTMLNPKTDIAENANSRLWCIDSTISINDVAIHPIDSPLASFGESAIFKSNIGKFVEPKEYCFVFNLFNNMWGTNFPQWTEGDFSYEYVITNRKNS